LIRDIYIINNMFTKININNNTISRSTDTLLSFHNLKSQKLIKNYNEYQSIHSILEMAESEHFPLINSEFVHLWLKNQNTFFRKSKLSFLLISGYSRTSKPSLFKLKVIPKEIQNMILLYTNLIFIKLYDQNSYSLLSVDCNFTVNNLCKILEIENGKMCKISTKFDANFSSIFKDGRYENLSLNQVQKGADQVYIDIPAQVGSKLYLKDMDDGLARNEILEFRLNFGDDEAESNQSHFEWLCSLKFGDIVDVFNEDYGEWVEGVIIKRDFDGFYIDCIDCNDSKDMNIIKIRSIGCDNLDCLQRRYSHCKQNKLYHDHPHNDNMLLFCDWTYYPILIE